MKSIESPKISFNKGRWSREEHELFLKGLGEFGENWQKVSGIIKTRGKMQVRSHAQKYFMRIKIQKVCELKSEAFPLLISKKYEKDFEFGLFNYEENEYGLEALDDSVIIY
ncbi:unnamed protein product [Blepharisma stoltei]|uniref:Uncharacterized protein n=1 Tax=Blepharisma stoltei TaxID=1481888 RepID=A0AAU9IP53_9CILI|nr:unnamed protein product [Blepharisma stoltei]